MIDGRAAKATGSPSCRRATGASSTCSSSATWTRVARRGRAGTAASPTSCACPRSSGTRRCGQAVDAMLAGRFAEAERLRLEAAATGTRAGDLNAELFAKMIEFTANVMRREFLAANLEFALDKVANSPAGPAYRPSVAWLLAELGRHDEARTELARCLAPGASSSTPTGRRRSVNARSAACALGDREHAAMIYELLAPARGAPDHRGPRRRLLRGRRPTARRARGAARPRGRCRAPTAVTPSPSTRRWAPPSGPPRARRSGQRPDPVMAEEVALTARRPASPLSAQGFA